MSEPILLSEYADWAGHLVDVDVAYVASWLPQFTLRRSFGGSEFILNPAQFVGVVMLPSGRRIESHPKVPITSLFRMLAVAYRLPSPFRDEVAAFERIDDLFEFLAAHLADLIDMRLREGLHRAYVDAEDNLAAVRGRIAIADDLRHNAILRHRVYCRFSDFTWDIPENQIIRQVVLLLRNWGFRTLLRQRLADIDATMSEITPTMHRPEVIASFSYSRFNADYEPIHRLCRLFLDCASLSNDVGTYTFRSFLIDMNRLFEQFVTQSMEDWAASPVSVRSQWSSYLGANHQIAIRPDIVVDVAGQVALVADCKYKRTEAGVFRNHDYYQMLAYCTALGIPRGFLVYPLHEQVTDVDIPIRQSEIVVYQRTLDLSGRAKTLAEACEGLWSEFALHARSTYAS